MTPREKWYAYFQGDDVGPMVAPLVDNWSLDEAYYWPYDEPEPFPAGHPQHALAQQMAMAKVCDYDPLYYAGMPFEYTHGIISRVEERQQTGRRIIETHTETPYGDLHSILEVDKTQHVIKSEVQTREDYAKMLWFVKEQAKIDRDASIARGREITDPVGDKGLIGTWWGPPKTPGVHQEEQYDHMAEYPDLYHEVQEALFEVNLAKLETVRAMGFDFLFYCVDGTEWISPNYFEKWIAPYTEKYFARWRELGGVIVWHSCGHLKEFVHRGYYNSYLPEILETLSEEPYGNLPSLKWAREKIDPRIATKGNIDLQLIHDGPTEAIRAEVQRVKSETAGYRHITGASDDILEGTPLQNMRAFVEEARQE